MTRLRVALLAIPWASLLFVASDGGDPRLDRSGAFFYPRLAATPDRVVATTLAGDLDLAIYQRYLLGQYGSGQVPDLAFDYLLARECDALGLARSAPALARSLALRRLHESGRTEGPRDPDQQRRFANEALRKLRVDALVRVARSGDASALRDFFDLRYGVGGERVVVRHVLVAFAATRRRLERAGEPHSAADVARSADERAAELYRRATPGHGLAEILAESDDRLTRRALRRPEAQDSAGVVEGYNYRRYGDGFAAAVRSLAVGEVSLPVASSVGIHLVEVRDRTVTTMESVSEELRAELARGEAKPSEEQALRARLFKKYEFALAEDK